MPSRSAVLVLLCVGMALAQTPGGARLRGEAESEQTRRRIAEAQRKVAAGQSAEAADELQRVLEESGNDLVLVKNGSYQPARRLVQVTLASLPADALKTLRARLDPPAQRLLDAGAKSLDSKTLEELRERYFVARPTEKAIDLLGELHFERGEFAAAERCWRTLLPATDPADLVYPSPAGDRASYRAKAVLAAFAAGECDRAADELAVFTKEHPQAKGWLAGTDGVYAETLAAAFRRGDFPATASAPTLPRFPAMRPMWKTPIPQAFIDRGAPRPASVPPVKALAFHPVVLNGFAYVANAGQVWSFDLRDGKPRLAFDLRKEEAFAAFDPVELALPNLNGAAFTITVAGGRLYVRLGPTLMPGGPDGAKPKQGSVIVALEPQPGGQLKKVGWFPPPAGGTWEGSPLVEEGRITAAFVRTDDRGRQVSAVACFTEAAPAKPLWVVDVAEGDGNQTAARHRGERLTAAGSRVVFAVPNGPTIALDRMTGRAAWAFRNPSATRPSLAVRDFSPPVYAADKVFIAPIDGDRVYGLDADSGRVVWESAAGTTQYLIGVTDGKLIAAVSGPQKGIRGYRLSDGSTVEPFGWQNHDDPFLATNGRGITGANGILWPTMEKLYRLNPADGSVQSLPKPGPHGNLAFGDGMLVVATPTEVWAYEGIPTADEPESPKPPPVKLITAPAPGKFDPVASPAIALPVVLERTELMPARPACAEGVTVGGLRLGFVGERHLIATDPSSAAIAWSLDALGRKRTPTESIESMPRFAPAVLPAGDGVWVQTSHGERWLVQAKSGSILHRETTADVLWAAPPVSLVGDRVIFSDGPGLLRCDDQRHRRIWEYDAGREASLTGVPPQAALLGESFVVAVHRNHGIELQRLDPDTGHPRWRQPVVVGASRFDWSHVCHDDSRIYVPTDAGVVAIELSTGRESWRSTANGRWKLVRARKWVLAHSPEAEPVEQTWDVTRRVIRSGLARTEFPRTILALSALPFAALDGEVRLIALDPATGRLEGSQTLPAVTGSTVEFTRDQLAVRSPGTVTWWVTKR